MGTPKWSFSNAWLYWTWGFVSSIGLAAAAWLDPYLFGYGVFGALLVSGILVVEAVLFHRRYLPWAVMVAIPAVVSWYVLSGYRWA